MKGNKGQATTEVVLLFPVFLMFLLLFSKMFALLILVQKVEITSFYASRRWQLESHRNFSYDGFDQNQLRMDIQDKALAYLGYGSSAGNFLSLTNDCQPSKDCPNSDAPGVKVSRTQVWNVVTVTACTKPYDVPFYPGKTLGGYVFCSTKYVPNRDRPIAFVLPGLNP